jgi:protease-4
MASPAIAEPPPKVSDPLPDPGKSIVSDDDSSAIAVNPANIAFLRGPELRWEWFYTQPSSKLPTRGHEFDFVYPLWIFASGLRLDIINPPDASPDPFRRDNYQWVRWSLGGRIGQVLGLGTTFGWSISPDPNLGGQFSFTAGATLRPSSYVGFAVVARDLNIPTSSDGFTRSERSYDFGAALRPIFGKRSLEVGAELGFHETSKQWVPRATLGVDIPYVGRLRADTKVFDLTSSKPTFLATAGLDVNLGPAQVSGGAVFGNDIGYDATGFYAGAAFRWFREPGIPLPANVVRIDIESTPGTRGHLALLRRLWRLAEDPECEGVLMVMHDEPAATLAHADEIGDAFRTLRAHGKKVICHLEDAGGRSLFACSQADRIAMNPAGGLRFAGLSSRYFYLGGTLEKLSVKADFVRIGPHKTAAEQLTNTTASDIAKADHQELVDQAEAVFLHDVGGGRNISRSKLRATIAKGPFLAKEARDAGLVDTLAYPDEVGEVVDEVMGKRASIAAELPLPRAPSSWTAENQIAVIYLDGDMVDGESQTIPLVGIRLAGSRTISKAFQEARANSSIKAVVFRVETGGGSSLAADVILREVQLTAKVKPVIVSMGSAAASGGYYVSVGGSPIFANRTTITGSIGIFYGKVDFSGLLSMLGVHSDAFRSAPRADAESLFRPFTDDEREELGHKVKQFYDLFVGRVTEGRKMTPDAVDAIGRGKVWTGAQARENGLVDQIGGFREALAEARRAAKLRDDTPILELPEEEDTLLGILLGLVGLKPSSAAPAILIPPAMVDVARVLAPFLVYGSDQPLARAELFEETSLSKQPFGASDDTNKDASVE